MTISDVSELTKARSAEQTHRSLLAILQRKRAFEHFMEDAREQLRKARVLRLASDTGFVRRVLEGLRSQADSYGISAVVQLIDAIEARPQIDQADLDAIAEAFRQFLRANAAILGLGFERKSSPFSSQERLERLRPTAPMPGEAEPASTEPAPRDSKR